MRKALILFAFVLLSLSSVYAWDWDNVKDYDNNTGIITIRDSLLGIPTTKVAEAKLETPQVNFVPANNYTIPVAKFWINLSDTEYKDWIAKIDTYNLNDNWKEINKTFIVKKRSFELKLTPLYQIVCRNYTIQGKLQEVCQSEFDRNALMLQEIWTPIENATLRNGWNYIGLFTEVKPNEKVEWIPTIMGVRINEWAAWDSSLNVGLRANYHFDEANGIAGAVDSLGALNFTGTVGRTTNGKIYNATYGDAAGSAKLTRTGLIGSTDSITINAWVKLPYTSCPSCSGIVFGGGNTNSWFGDGNCLGTAGSSRYYFNNVCTNFGRLDNNTWHMVTMTCTSGGPKYIYVNGVLNATDAGGCNTFTNVSGDYNVNRYALETEYGDELSIWNRTLSSGEITQLYTDQLANKTYEAGGSVTPTMNATQSSPANNYNTSQSVDFKCNFSSTNQNISSVQLRVYDSSNNLDYNNSEGGLSTPSYNKTWSSVVLRADIYNWSCTGYGNLGVNYTTGNRTLNITALDRGVITILTNPADALVTTNTNQQFNWTVFPTNVNISNSTLLIYNNSGLFFNTSGSDITTYLGNESYNYSKSVTLTSNQNYSWRVLTCYRNSSTHINCTYSTTNRTIDIDNTSPSLSLIYPTSTTYSTNSLGLNYTVSDRNLQTCWYSNNSGITNYTITCGNNATAVTASEGNNTWRVYANDSAGNQNSSSVTFSVDSTAPLISFYYNSEINATTISRNNININTRITETNFANMSVRLYNGSNSLLFTNRSYTNISSSTCYQETTTVATACGGLSTGTYYGQDISVNNYDGNWNTEYQPTYFVANYTIPQNFSSAVWQVKYGASSISNYTVPTQCFQTDVLSLRFESYNILTTSYMNLTCYSLGKHYKVTPTDPSFLNELYEEAVYWIPATQVQTSNFTSLSDGVYYFNATAYDIFNRANSTETRKVTIDTTGPNVTIVSPTGSNVFNDLSNLSLSLKATYSDASTISSCYYYTSFNYTNTTLASCGNTTIIAPTAGSYTVYVYALDAAGNLGFDTSIFSVDFLSYSNSSYETDNETFTFSYSYPANLYTKVSGYLNYNGTRYSTSPSTTNPAILTSSLDVPLVSSFSQTKTLFWELTLQNTTGTFYENSSWINQTVARITLDKCNQTLNVSVINFTAYNISSFLQISPYTFGGTFEYYLGSGSVKKNVSVNQTSPDTSVCISPTNLYLTLYSTIEYSAAGFYKNNYYIFNQIYDNITSNISLYLLQEGLGTITAIKINDETSLGLPNHYAQMYVYDPGTNRNYLYSVLKSNQEGQDVGYFKWYDTLYTTLIYNSSGELLYTGEPYKIGSTPQTYRVVSDGSNSQDKFAYVTVNLTYSNDTRTFTAVYSDVYNEITHGCLRIVYQRGTNQSILSDQCVAGSSGIVTYTVPDGMIGGFWAIFYAKGSEGGVLASIFQNIKEVRDEIYDAIGEKNGAWLALIIVGTATFIGLFFGPSGVIIMAGLGYFVSFLIGLQNYFDAEFYLAFIGLLVVGGYIAWKARY